MSLHWTLIAGFLYVEIGVVLLLLLPFISPKRWSKFFTSRFLRGLETQLGYYFYILVAILILFFLDAVREMKKYGDNNHVGDQTSHTHLDAQMQMHMRLFRAQRNFYISGFSLFLCLVIRRMINLLSRNSILEAEKEAAMKQAVSASRTAEMLMSDGTEENKVVKDLKEELKTAQNKLEKAEKDVKSMKTQSLNLTEQYDRLMEEKDTLERKLKVMGGSDDKKDN